MTKLGYTPHQFLTLCSVVERESLFDKDRPAIAGVFINRLKTGMRLQSDITVNYALNRTGVKVSTKMTKIDSPYNTQTIHHLIIYSSLRRKMGLSSIQRHMENIKK